MSKHRPASINDSIQEPITFPGNTRRKNKTQGKSLLDVLREKRKENTEYDNGQQKDNDNDSNEDTGSRNGDRRSPVMRFPTTRTPNNDTTRQSPILPAEGRNRRPRNENNHKNERDTTKPDSTFQARTRRLIKFIDPLPRSTSTPMNLTRRYGTPSTALNISRDEETPLPVPYQQTPGERRVARDFPKEDEEKNEGWQDEKSLAECNEYMLTYELGCDVTFLVGEMEEAVMAHSYILMSRSSKFYHEIMRKWNQVSRLITVPDVYPETFRRWLMYIYTDEIELDVTLANALLHVANKYGPCKLKNTCFKYLLSEMSSENANIILENAHKYESNDVYQRCLQFINVNAEDVLKTANIRDLCKECIEDIVKSDNLNASEYTVYSGLVVWANAECARRKLQPNDITRREVLDSLLYCIRFPIMDVREFTQRFSQTNILKSDEKLVLYQYFHGQRSKPPERFNMNARKTYVVRNSFGNSVNRTSQMEEPKLHKPVQERQYSPNYELVPYERNYEAAFKGPNQPIMRVIRFKGISGSWQMKGPDAISFSCSMPIVLHGVQIFGPYRGNDSYVVDLTVYDDMRTEIRKQTISMFTEKTKVYDVLLTDAIRLPPRRNFTVQTMVKGVSTIRGIDGVCSVTTEGVTFEFVNSNKSLNGTDVTMGQIPALLFSKIVE